MQDASEIDVAFDVRTDAGDGDPDTTSPTLRRYHQLLWSKPLPDGTLFTLDTSSRRRYLHHSSARGDFFLASDTCVPTYRSWLRMAPIIERISGDDLNEFQRLNHTIGGMMVFPGERRSGVQTLNGARGWSPAIGDRLDLTLECVRLAYRGQPNPLGRVLEAYWDFFALFETFEQYVDFFLLQDLVDDGGRVVFMRDFRSFDENPLPADVDDYLAYRVRAMAFLAARNTRIEGWANQTSPSSRG
ncbi:DUF6994 family protein [Agrococcus jejuensis]|uniref:DUF6994 family protein n=1 Tax=Agrococcus jejuensis TaxID=399736 RepID=UPI0011AA7A22|nr:hypothetical protein [Agrococcus jejuensis]